MIQNIAVKNYQSHRDTQLELGGLTVLVGDSSAGKSAVTRAIKATTSNQSGKDYITHGEQTMQVSIKTDRGTLVFTKGKPEDSYVILDNDDPTNPRRYTKLGVQVPPDVTAFLGIEPKDAINFAGQFDMPYLLKTSSAEVARVLGELTNVSTIFEASREGLRLKTAASTSYKTREADLASITPKLEAAESINARLEALEQAEISFSTAQGLNLKLERLRSLINTLTVASSRLRVAQEATAAPLPDLQPILELHARHNRLGVLLTSLASESRTIKEAREKITSSILLTNDLVAEYDEALQLAGTCPTCGQDTSTKGHTHESE